MANQPLPVTKLLQEPGFLYWAPLATALPANTGSASGFSDIWPAAWIPLGATESGSDFTYTPTVQPVMVAELYDPIAYRTTDRTSSLGFMLASVTAANLTKMLNGAVNVVTGVAPLAVTTISPPVVGSEVRCQLGWESYDSSMRLVGFQVLNGGAMKMAFNKAPAKTTLPWMGNFETPGSGTAVPWQIFVAGTNR